MDKNRRGKFCDVAPLVAPKIKISNSKTKNTETYDGDFWWQIYEELKQLYNLKDLIAPLEEKRLQEEQKRTQANSCRLVG